MQPSDVELRTVHEATVGIVFGRVGAVVLERGDQRLGPIVESYYKIYTTNYYFSLYAALLFQAVKDNGFSQQIIEMAFQMLLQQDAGQPCKSTARRGSGSSPFASSTSACVW